MDNLEDPLLYTEAPMEYMSEPAPLYYNTGTETQQRSHAWTQWLSRRVSTWMPMLSTEQRFQYTLKVTRWILHLTVLAFIAFLTLLVNTWTPTLLAFAAHMALLHVAGHLTQIFHPRDMPDQPYNKMI